MASAANPPDDASNDPTTWEAMDKIEFPILRLPLELQVEVLKLINHKYDLKALRLVCKEISEIATPCLYYSIDLLNDDDYRVHPRINQGEKDTHTLQRIQSLLMNPANLRFVRVLNAGQFGMRSTDLMDQVLPLLRKDYLARFNYSTRSTISFPTPLQMKLLWCRQKELRNLELCSHMVPALKEFLKEYKSGQSILLNSFTELDISDDREGSSTNTPSKMYWPLKYLDMRHLRSLSLNGRKFCSIIVSKLNDLFAGGSFVNLTDLSFERLNFAETLTLANVPSLDSLFIDHCGPFRGVTLPMAVADNFGLKSLTYLDYGKVEKLTPLLAQIKGLESLVVKPLTPIYTPDQVIKDFTRALIVHKKTLRVFKLKVNLRLLSNAKTLQWEANFVERIRRCNKLVDLSLPLVSNQTTCYYHNLIATFPSLSSLTIYTRIDTGSTWSPYRALGIFPACTRLKSVLIKGPGKYSDEFTWFRRRFVREELEELCRPSSQVP